MIKIIEDRYDGVIVDNTSFPENKEEFKDEILDLISSFKNKKLLWVKIPIEKSEFIPVLTRLDFEFHHCEEKSLTLIKKLTSGSFVPTTKNYIVGVGAIVFHNGKLLVIKDKFQAGYKLPGGHIDKQESIKEALKREVAEETGIDIEFESIMNIGHFRHGQFGESNMYIVCTAKALSTEIMINDFSEITEARWIDPIEFLALDEVNDYNKSVVQAAIRNKELKLTNRQVKLRIPDGEVFF